jgi:hypothetical protein
MVEEGGGEPAARRLAARPKGENGREDSREFRFRFLYFPVIFILFRKYGNRYKNGVECRKK